MVLLLEWHSARNLHLCKHIHSQIPTSCLTHIQVNKTSSAGDRESTLTTALSTPTSTNNQEPHTATYDSSVPTNIQISSTSYSGSSGGDFNPYPPAFPKVLKIEERRVPRGAAAVQPYCVQKILDPDGVPQIYPNSTGQPNIVYLNETAPSSVSSITDKRDIDRYVDLQTRELIERQSSNSCGCAWIWT
jgi:hypothetical protein